MKKNLIYIFVIIFFAQSFVTASDVKYYIRIADSEIKRNPESWMLDFAPKLKWDYCNGLELQAIYSVWKKTGNPVYFNYVNSYADTIIQNDGSIISYKLQDYNIDRVNSGKILFPLYTVTKNEKYRKAIELLRDQMKTHPRTSEGGFWHKKVYPHQMWLDGLYMASPFLAEYAKRNNDKELFDDVANQILTVAKHTYDAKTGLYYHGWDESHQQRWSNPETGTSPNFWSRSIGWYMMAIVDVLDYLPADHPKRPEIIKILLNLSQSLDKFRDKKTGLWYQVTDKGSKKGNYIESSGSAMFIYTWVKGAQKGYLPKSFLKKGEKAYAQYVKQFVKENPDQTISITNACSVAGLGGDKKYRDGSFEYYISEPKRDNDPKAVAPFMMVSVLLNK
ncbi:MAG: glycoside hydrolase family 88/105 protein [Paludibacter sp.]